MCALRSASHNVSDAEKWRIASVLIARLRKSNKKMPGCTDKLKQYYTQLFTAAALFAAANAIAATPAEGISGQWRIVSVNTDQRAMTYPATKYNDPRLVGRVLNFGQDAIRGDADGDIDCQQPTYRSQPEMTLNTAIQQTSGEHNDAPVTPVAEDYELNIPGDQKITPLLVSCKQGSLGPDGVVMKNWVAQIAADRLITNWSENGYLMLQRVKPGEKTAPGFSCNVKLSTVEKTICDSDELSARGSQCYRCIPDPAVGTGRDPAGR
ncbi:hypothetical protein CWS02_11630 [Enterobacter sp. EA-1]|nr:hypothetical protein CWS02_11630 [Enterobacter sp. EA-1]